MSEQIVNALAQMKQVYLEEVGHNNLERQRLEEEVRQINEFKKPKLDRVGEEDDDVDNDGDVDSSDKYLKHRRSVVTQEVNSDLAKEILKAMKNLKKGGTPNSDESADNVERIMRSISSLKPPVKESSYYNWRDTVDESILWEIIDDTEQKQVKEKNINNHTGKNPVVTVNPDIKTESVLIDTQELNEDFIEESINIAADYLCEEGLSLEEIEDLIDELGVEEFSEWVMQLGYETLELIERKLRSGETALPARTRERLGANVSRKSSKELKGGAAQAKERSDAARREARAAARQTPEPTERQKRLATLLAKQKSKKALPPGQQRIISGAKKAVKTAASPETVRPILKTALNTAARAALSGWEGHKKAMATKKAGGTTGQALRQGLGAATSAFWKKGTSQFTEWVEDLIDEGYDLSDWTWDELYEEYEVLQEKAVSEQQQKIFGLALSVKRGETPRSKVSDEVLKIVDSMSEKEIRKYAKTSHEGIPKTVNESFLVEKVINFIRENR